MKFYDKTGEETSEEKFLELYADRDYRRVAADLIGDWLVSTVWLGVDMRGDLGTTLVFETMAFPSTDEFIDDWVEHTHSEEDARAAHQRGVDYTRRKIAGTQ